MARPKNNIPMPARMVPDPGPVGIVQPNLSRNWALPRLDTQAHLAPARGMSDVGQGMQQLGSAMSALGAKVAEAQSLTGQRKAQEIMAQQQAAMQLAISEAANEPDKWQDIAAKYLDQTDTQLAALDLDPDTRAAVDHRAVMNRADVVGSVGSQANRKKLQLGADALMNTMRIAGETGDRALYEQTRKIAGEGPYPFMREDELKIQDAQFDAALAAGQKRREAEVLDLQKKNVAAFASATPLADVERYIETLSIPPDDRASLRNYAQAINRDGVASLSDAVANGMATGEIWNEYELDATFGHSPFMTPAVRESFRANLQKMDILKQRAAKEGPAGVENFVRTYSAALAWEPDRSEKSQRELAERIMDVKATVPEDYAGEVTSLLHQKFGTIPPKGGAVRPEVQTAVSRTIAEKFRQRLAPLDARVSRLPEVKDGGKMRKQGPGDADYDAAQKVADDRTLENIRQQAALEMKMSEWYQANPKGTADAALNHLNTLLPEPDRINDWDMLRFSEPLPEPPLDRTEAEPGQLEQPEAGETNSGRYQSDGRKMRGGVPEPDLPAGSGDIRSEEYSLLPMLPP